TITIQFSESLVYGFWQGEHCSLLHGDLLARDILEKALLAMTCPLISKGSFSIRAPCYARYDYGKWYVIVRLVAIALAPENSVSPPRCPRELPCKGDRSGDNFPPH